MLSHYLKNALACLIAVVGSALLLEFGLRASAQRGWIEIDYNPVNGFWADINPDFGVWHRSNASYTHEKACFRVTYATNSYGALDRERTQQSVESRVVVLGD